MTILLVHNYYQQAGGEDTVFATEIALLRQYGHGVVEYTDDNQRIGGMRRLAVAVQSIWSHNSKNKLLAILRGTRPDVAHFHNTFLLISPSAYYACRKVGVPVVQTLHNYRLLCLAATLYRGGHVCEDCLGRTPPWPGIVHACYRDSPIETAIVSTMLTVHRWFKTWQEQVDVYIALTEFARKKFIEGGLPSEKIVVKPNFVYPDPGTYRSKGNYVLYVGRLSPEKGVKTLLRAWLNLRKIPLKIVGDGPLMEEVKTFVETQGLKNVQILGRLAHEDVLKLIKSACFLVFPSEWYEGFPMTIAEVFACGISVVTPRLGAMEEIVEDKRTGLHFKSGNPEDLADKVEWAWTHVELMQEMGREARREYEEKYTAEKNYKMLLDIYEKAMSYHKRSSL